MILVRRAAGLNVVLRAFSLSFPYSVDGMPEMAVFLLGLYSNCLFVRNRYLPIAFDKGNEGIPSVVTRIVQVECE